MVIRVGDKPNGSTNAPAFGPRKRPKGVKIPEAMVFSVYPAGKDPKGARITHASNYPIIFNLFSYTTSVSAGKVLYTSFIKRYVIPLY